MNLLMALLAAMLTAILPPATHHGMTVHIGRVAECQTVDMAYGHASDWHWHCRPFH